MFPKNAFLCKFVNVAVAVVYLVNLFPGQLHASVKQKTQIDVVEKAESMDFDLESLSREDKKQLKKLFADPVNESIVNAKLISALNEKKKSIAKHYGFDSYLEKVFSRKEKEAVIVQLEGQGYAEVKVIGTGDRAVTVDKIVNEKTGRTYVIVDFDQLPLRHLELSPETMDSEEYKHEMRLRKYLAFHIRSFVSKQLIFSGNTRNVEDIDSELVAKHLKKVLNQPAEEVVSKEMWHSIVKKPGNIQGMDMEGNPFGHDVTLIMVADGKQVRTETHRAPRSKTEGSFWSNYFHAIYEHPEFERKYWEQGGFNKLKILFTGDVFIGWGFAGLQVLVALGLGLIEASALPEAQAHLKEAVWVKYEALAKSSAVFGVLFGVYTRTFQNWYLDYGKATWFSRDAKAWAVALAYGFSVYLQIYGVDAALSVFSSKGGVSSLNMASLATGAWAVFLVVSNIIIKGWSKRWSMEIPKYDKATGESYRNIEIPNRLSVEKLKLDIEFFNKPIKTSLQKAGIQVQLYQLFGTIPKMAHLADMRINIPGIGMAPVGFLMYPAMIPAFHLWVMKHAESYVGAYSKIAGPAAKKVASELYPNKELERLTGYEKVQIFKVTSERYPYFILRDAERLAIEYRTLWNESKWAKVPYLKTVSVGAFNLAIRNPLLFMKLIATKGPAWTFNFAKSLPRNTMKIGKASLNITKSMARGALKVSGPSLTLVGALHAGEAGDRLNKDTSYIPGTHIEYNIKPRKKKSCGSVFSE